MRYVVPLSGKDSIALAYLLHKLHPDREFVYPGTPVVDREPDELIPWLEEAARRCGGEYIRVNNKGFDELLNEYGGFLPSARARWCTRKLKIEPMEKWLAEQEGDCTIYLGLRADEDRDGNTGEKKGFTYEYPLLEHGIDERGALLLVAELFDVKCPSTLAGRALWDYLIDKGALPPFYRWLTHANCYGCIFWRIDQWRELYFREPEMYKRFSAQEDVGSHFTYRQNWSLEQLAERFEIESGGFKLGPRRKKLNGASQILFDINAMYDPSQDDEWWQKPCAACRIGG